MMNLNHWLRAYSLRKLLSKVLSLLRAKDKAVFIQNRISVWNSTQTLLIDPICSKVLLITELISKRPVSKPLHSHRGYTSWCHKWDTPSEHLGNNRGPLVSPVRIPKVEVTGSKPLNTLAPRWHRVYNLDILWGWIQEAIGLLTIILTQSSGINTGLTFLEE